MTDESKTPRPDSAGISSGRMISVQQGEARWTSKQITAACVLSVIVLMTLIVLVAKLTMPPPVPTDGITQTEKAAEAAAKAATSAILRGEPASSDNAAAPSVLPPAAAPQTPTSSLTNDAKFEVTTLSDGAGAAYNSKLKNVPLVAKAIHLDSKDAVEARAVFDRYLAADGWRGKLAFVFQPERVEALMRDYYDKRGEQEPVPGRRLGASVITGGDSVVVNLSFACPSRPEAGLRANFHRNNAGKLLLDWEAWVAFSERAWPDFKRDRQVVPTLMRAIASEDDYYNYEFADERWRYLAVKLRSPNGVHSLTGYCIRSSALGIAMANLIGVPVPQPPAQKDQPSIPIRPPGTKSIVTVRVAFPPSAQSDHCVKITDLLADRWMLFNGEF